MASEDYLPLFWRARREHLGNIARVSAEIVKLYRDAAADLAARAAASRKGSLTERWASEYAESLKKRTAELNAGLYEVTLQGLKRSAGLPTIAMGEWWEMVGGQSFRDAFAATPDSVLAGIIEGSFYKDNKGLSERIWRVADSFEKDIGYIVNRGIAEKKSALELARDLEQYVKPPAKRDFDWGKVYPNLSGKKVDFNAQRLARTSINHAYHLDNVKVCTENPFVTAMHWDLSNAHYERQVIPFGPDECDEYAAHDEGLGEGNFKPEEIPVPHPQCLCVQWAVIPRDLEDIGAQIGRWASGEPDAVLDEWYDKYGNRNPNGDPKEILREGLKYDGNGGIINLTEQEVSAVNAYISSESYVINEKLRKDFHLLNEDEKAIVSGLDSALQKMPKHEGILYRSMSSDMIENLDEFWALHQVGKVVTYDAYTSASLEVYDDTMDIQCIIQSKNGRDMTGYNPNEQEILFERESSFWVTGIEGNTILLLEV